MEWKAVRYTAGDGVGLITLNRPHRSNAWTGRMAFEYRTAMQLAEQDGRVGVIVVTGEGRHFCVGADTRALDRFAESGKYESGVRDPLPEPGEAGHPAYGTVFGFPLAVAKPVIAAVNGAVAGVGLVLACFTDIRFGAAGAKWTPSGSRLGLPAEHAVSWILPRLIGYGRAAEWLFSSRVVLSEEAQAMGLVHAVHPPEDVLEATLAYARALLDEAAPSSLRTTKRQLTLDLFRPLAESAGEADRFVEEMIGSDDYRQGIKALIEKRPPGFAERYKGF
ncbi:MAG: enoyl-CoA hydratase/isomerase family protein [Actinobacteria bacterium]|nr:enoyl-CoA hydratase/isomerase family protein [Actinomycetota bacterium]